MLLLEALDLGLQGADAAVEVDDQGNNALEDLLGARTRCIGWGAALRRRSARRLRRCPGALLKQLY